MRNNYSEMPTSSFRPLMDKAMPIIDFTTFERQDCTGSCTANDVNSYCIVHNAAGVGDNDDNELMTTTSTITHAGGLGI